MSYTIAIQGKKAIDGSKALRALAETTAEFHDPASSKKAEGYISVDGKTCVGVAFASNWQDEITNIEQRLRQAPELETGKVMVRALDLGPHKMGVVNLLVPQPEISFLARVFDEVGSNLWIMENTGWWPEYNDEISITPPGIVYPKDRSPFIIFRVGTVTLYFDETKKDSERTIGTYNGDNRGYLFRQKHADVHVSQVGDLLFSEEIESQGYQKALQRLATNEGTGLSHGYTIVYFDELNNALTCAHLMHENTRGRWEKLKATDVEGNDLVVAGGVTTENFLRHWPHELSQDPSNIEGVVLTRFETPNLGIERIR